MSVVRVGILVGIIGVALLVVGVFSFFADQQSRRAPLEVAVYPGAEQWGYGANSGTQRTTFYRAAGVQPDQVAAFYDTQMAQFYGAGNEEDCVRNPGEGEYEIDPSVPNAIPYRYQCIFDRSGMGTSQYTLVTIYPGLANDDPLLNAVGTTVIEVAQTWQG